MSRRLVYTSVKNTLATYTDTIWYAYQHNGDFIHVFRAGGYVYRLFDDASIVYSCKMHLQLRDPIVGVNNHGLIRVGDYYYRMDQACAGRREAIISSFPYYLSGNAKESCWLETEGKILQIQSTGKIYVYSIVAGVVSPSYVDVGYVDGIKTTGWTQLVPYRQGLVAAYNTNGRIAVLRIAGLLDGSASESKLSDTSIGSGLTYVCWSRWNELFWGVKESTGQTFFWADLVQPTAVSAIELLDLPSPLHTMTGTRIRARVTSPVDGHPSSTLEPVAGWFVDWSLSGPGFLQQVQSETDVDGYALNYYFGPLSNAGLPLTATITASIND